MCTLALYFKAFHEVPLVVAANRDEHYDRPSAAPVLLGGAPGIVAGRDLRVGGTWMGINDNGLFVGILNRRANAAAHPQSEARSRGLLCMDLLKTDDALAARIWMQAQRQHYQPFTVVFADAKRAWAAYNTQEDKMELIELSAGLHVFSSHAEVDLRSEKADRAYRQFAALLGDQPGVKDQAQALGKLQTFLSDHNTLRNSADGGREAICVHSEVSGTVSASVVFLSEAPQRFRMFHCPGPPCRKRFGQALTLPVR